MESELPRVTLKTTHHSRHPWIFQKMVERPSQKLKSGTVVDIFEKGGEWYGRGFYNGFSKITLRVLTDKQDELINADFFKRRIDQAVKLRHSELNLPAVTDAYRLVHAEGDNLGGLVVEKFGNMLVLEFFSAGMFQMKDEIMSALRAHFPECEFYWFADPHVERLESIKCDSPPTPRPFQITEHGLKFFVEPGGKHKTGFFLDQRENRNYLAQFCKGKRVLDICCNSGGFAVYAKGPGGADEVVALDLDEVILKLAERNAKANKTRIRFVHVDLFPWLRDAISRSELFDVVVLDPSKQTRDRDEVDEALKRYTDMNRLAMQVIKPGGILLTCSCTGLVKEEDFILSVQRAAKYSGRTVQIFKISGAAPDHPFLVNVFESRYLKALWCRVI